MPDPDTTRKSSRLGLYIPFGLLGLAIIAWTAAWFWARGQVESRLDSAQAALRKAGYELSWESRSVDGFPYRLNITLIEPRIADPSGWAIATPRLEGQTYLLSAGHWMIAATEGLTFTRPMGGPVTVTGDILRASLRHMERRPPNISFEGVKLRFAPGAGAMPFALSAADRVELHFRAGPDDEGGVFAKVEGGKARLSGLFARIAEDKPITMTWNSTLSKMSAFRGNNWPQAVRAWTAAGGRITVRDAGVTAGEAVIGTRNGTLTVGADGRIRGALDLSLRQAPKTIAAMGETGAIPPTAAVAAAVVAQARQQGDIVRATLTFQAGQITLGPVALAPAPRVY